MSDDHQAESKGGQHFNIQIDRVHYKVLQQKMTGAELRSVPPVLIPSDRDLFMVVPGGTDRKIGDGDVIDIKDGERFFTAPGRINPGLKKREVSRGARAI